MDFNVTVQWSKLCVYQKADTVQMKASLFFVHMEIPNKSFHCIEGTCNFLSLFNLADSLMKRPVFSRKLKLNVSHFDGESGLASGLSGWF